MKQIHLFFKYKNEFVFTYHQDFRKHATITLDVQNTLKAIKIGRFVFYKIPPQQNTNVKVINSC